MNDEQPLFRTAYRDCIHRAGWVVKDPETVIRDGYVLVAAGKIRDIGRFNKKTIHTENRPLLDHGPGALVPALINAHTHLELSCFKNDITCGRGFEQWVRDLITLREKCSTTDMIAGADRGLKQILETGTGALCEIASLGLSAGPAEFSGLYGLWCREFLGNLSAGQQTEPERFTGRMKASLAGHAPHTTAPELLARLKRSTARAALPFSIHLAESDAETKFIKTGQGPWADFLLSRSIDFSDWGVPARSPVAYADHMGILDKKTLCVHVLQANDHDLDTLARRGAAVCLCPRSNQALHGRLPDIAGMLSRGIPVCLGTDSLASTPNLDLFDEMAFTAAHADTVEPDRVLAMATLNGARSMGVSTLLGDLSPGKAGLLVYVPVTSSRRDQLLRSIVTRQFSDPVRPLFFRNNHLNKLEQ